MFKKLIANLPFNPSLLEELVYYSKRVSKEVNLRKMGFWLLVLALAVQAAIALYPPSLNPAKGPALAIAIGFILAAISGFLYARSRIIALELEIVRLSYITTGEA